MSEKYPNRPDNSKEASPETLDSNPRDIPKALSYFRRKLLILPYLLVPGGDAQASQDEQILEDTIEFQGPIQDDLEDVKLSKFETVLNLQRSAKDQIKEMQNSKNIEYTSRQERILDKALNYPENHIMSLAIMESHLKSNKNGYMQLTPIAISDINKHLPFVKASMAKAKADPLMHMTYGILYLAITKDRYLDFHTPYKSLPEEDRFRLNHLMYNLGLGHTKHFWREFQAESVDDFIEHLESKVAKYMGKDVGKRKNTWDPSYMLEYSESGIMTYYLANQQNARLKVSSRLKEGKKQPSYRKLMITGRYSLLTDAIAKKITDDPDFFKEIL